MDYHEIDVTASSMVLELTRLGQCLKQILTTELPQTVATGYTPESLYAGPLKQWTYVIKTHLAANPLVAFQQTSQANVDRYANYICYLIDHIHSDARFVSEMQLNWSLLWLQKGSSIWTDVLAKATVLRDELPAEQREKSIANAHMLASRLGNPWH